MRAGEHDSVGAPRIGVDKACGNFRFDLVVVDRAPANSASAKPANFGEPTSVPSQPRRIRGSARGIFTADSRLRAEHRHASSCSTARRPARSPARCRRKGRKSARELGERQRGGRVARHHHQVGDVLGNRRAEDLDDARDQRLFGLVAVGKSGVVRHIDVSCVRTRGTTSRNTVRPPRPESKIKTVGSAALRVDIAAKDWLSIRNSRPAKTRRSVGDNGSQTRTSRLVIALALEAGRILKQGNTTRNSSLYRRQSDKRRCQSAQQSQHQRW